MSGQDLNSKQNRDICPLMKNCRDVLEDLSKLIEKNKSLGTQTSTLGGKLKKTSKKLRWDPDEVRDLRARITSSTTVLNAFNLNLASSVSSQVALCLTNCSSATTRADAAILDKRVESLQLSNDLQERQHIFDWLCPLNLPTQQSGLLVSVRMDRDHGYWTQTISQHG